MWVVVPVITNEILTVESALTTIVILVRFVQPTDPEVWVLWVPTRRTIE
jgi:hypothetical protein